METTDDVEMYDKKNKLSKFCDVAQMLSIHLNTLLQKIRKRKNKNKGLDIQH